MISLKTEQASIPMKDVPPYESRYSEEADCCNVMTRFQFVKWFSYKVTGTGLA